jgi:hypothetical protein
MGHLDTTLITEQIKKPAIGLVGMTGGALDLFLQERLQVGIDLLFDVVHGN